jgi:uncharacterized protein (DUF1697 family)
VPAYIALLRAVNLGPANKLPMTELKAICERLGFAQVKTYIASGNVVFTTKKTAAQVKAELEAELARYAGKPVGVLVRTAQEMAAILAANPFHDRPGNWSITIFLDDPPAKNALDTVTNRHREELALGQREIYVFYADGIGDARLKIPAAKHGTMRNSNTLARLSEMANQLEQK